MNVALLLGLVDDTHTSNPPVGITGQTAVTSYVQLKSDGTLIDRYTPYEDVYVDDAWITADGKEYISSTNEFKDARLVAAVGNAPADALSEFIPGIRMDLNGEGHTTVLVRHHLTQGAIFASIKERDDVLLAQMDIFDDMVYELATEFNAIHYAGYGSGDYANITGLAFFDTMTGKYGAFGNLNVDASIGFDDSRLAAATGDGSGRSLGVGDGTNALSIARLKQAKLFNNGMANFDDLYASFVAKVGAAGTLAKTALASEDYLVEQISVQRESVMGVNADEEMLTLVEMNQLYNYSAQYITTLFDVIDAIIGGVGTVGL
jgi:flagellar hook-associated protein 1 FlgK